MSNSYLDHNGLKHYTDKLKQELQSQTGVTSFNGRKGEVLPVRGDYTVSQITGAVPNTRTINGKPLSEDITLSPTDIGVTTPDLSGYVPTTRTINGKALSSDVSLNATDIGVVISSNRIAINGNASANDTIALLGDVTENSFGGIAIGPMSRVSACNAIAIGYGAEAPNNYSTAIGWGCITASDYSTAIGTQSYCRNNAIVACGYNACSNGNNSICIGVNSGALYNNSISIGINSRASHPSSIAIGLNANCNNGDMAIGRSSHADGKYSMAIGGRTSALGDGSIAIGYQSNSKNNAIAIGYDAETEGIDSIAIGNSTFANESCSVAIGRSVKTYSNYSVSLGYNAHCTENNTIQLGDASSLSKLSCKVALSVTSDERDKTDITPIGDGAVEFLNRIKAIRYVFNGRELYIPEDENLSDVDRANKSKYGMCSYDKEAHALGTKKGERVRVGVLAQEVQKALQEVYGDKSYANLVDDNFFDLDPSTIPEGVENKLSLTYENFIPFLIKAAQELDQRVKELESKEV